MTKNELVKLVSNKTNCTMENVHKVTDALLDAIKTSTAEGKTIFLRGFGTLKPVVRKSKKGRVITENREIVIPAKKFPKFRPSDTYLELLNQKK